MATRAQTAEKTSCSSKPTRTSNPQPNTLSDQHNVLSEPNVGWGLLLYTNNYN